MNRSTPPLKAYWAAEPVALGQVVVMPSSGGAGGRSVEGVAPERNDVQLDVGMLPAHSSSSPHRVPIGPLHAFVARLAANGRRVAELMYGCDGWVGHGFSDGWLRIAAPIHDPARPPLHETQRQIWKASGHTV